jgi:L-xylulose reductase
MSFAGERIVVTGASKGIGRATAHTLARQGAHVIAMGRDRDELDSLRGEIGGESIVVDFNDPDAVRAAAQRAMAIDRLVNNAGTVTLEPFLDASIAAFTEQMNVNVLAAMILGKEAARSMIARGKRGAIVNVSSISSSLGFAGHAAYCASKGALDSLTMVMANELGAHGIRVNAVNPTVVLTPMGVKAWSDPAKAGPMLKRIPMGRFVEPEEVAEAIAYLLSDKAGMVTGVAMPVDGGFLIN